MHFEELITELGEFGRYQKKIYFLACIVSMVTSWHDLNMVFIGATPEFRCKTLEFNLSKETLGNLTSEERVGLFSKDSTSCYQFQPRSFQSKRQNLEVDDQRFDNISEEIIPCQNGFEFSKSEYRETIVSEFELVCDNKFWIGISKSIYFAGRISGAVIFGQLSDRYGRRPSFLAGSLLLLIVGTVVSFSQNMYFFLPMYFSQGAASTGAFLVIYTLSTELVGSKYRVPVGIVIHSFHSIGYMTLAGMAFSIKHWRYLEWAITFPVALFILYWWLLPESIQWLLSQGKKDEVEKMVHQVAQDNRVVVKTEVIERLREKSAVSSDRQYNVIDCVRTWPMARMSLNIWFSWLVNSLVYYGLSLNTENLAGDPYLNFCIAGAVDIPADVISIILLNKIGRRIPLVMFMYMAGVACVLSVCIPNNTEAVNIFLAMFAKFAITASYGIIHLMSAELFPTVIRSSGMGIASLSSGFGGILAPIFLDLPTDYKQLPLIILGTLSAVAASLALLLPETAGRPLPQTPDDVTKHRS